MQVRAKVGRTSGQKREWDYHNMVALHLQPDADQGLPFRNHVTKAWLESIGAALHVKDAASLNQLPGDTYAIKSESYTADSGNVNFMVYFCATPSSFDRHN